MHLEVDHPVKKKKKKKKKPLNGPLAPFPTAQAHGANHFLAFQNPNLLGNADQQEYSRKV